MSNKGPQEYDKGNIETLLIASYRERYTKESLEKIRNIIMREKPKKIIILKIIEEETTPEVVDATVGIEERQDFLDSVLEKKKMQANEYAADIIDITEDMGVLAEVHLRKGDEISEEIIEEFDKMDVDHVILHGADKGPVEKVLKGSTSSDVRDKLGKKKITLL